MRALNFFIHANLFAKAKISAVRFRENAAATRLRLVCLTRVDSRVRSRNCLAHGNFLSSGMRRSRTAAIGITHALTLCGRTLGAYHYSSPAFTISTHAAKAAYRGILRRETLLVSEIIFPSSPPAAELSRTSRPCASVSDFAPQMQNR